MATPLEEIREQLNRIEGLLRELTAAGARSASSLAPSSKETRQGQLRSAGNLAEHLLEAMDPIDAASYLRSKFSADPEQLAAALSALGPTCPSSSEAPGGDRPERDAGAGPGPRQAREALRRARGGGDVG